MLIISKCEIEKAAKILKDGGIVSFPTETVFGLGCICSNYESFKRLCKVKHRPVDKPFTLMCSSDKQVEKFLEISNKAKIIIRRFFPGQLTLILPTKNNVDEQIDLKTGFVGIRIPDDEFVLKLIEMVGEPLLVTSANISGDKPAYNDKEVENYFKDEIDCLVKGESKSNVPSTVIMLKNDQLILLREGIIKLNKIQEVIMEKKEKIVIASDHGGFKAKEALKQYLIDVGYEIIDVGTNSLESCNYAYFALEAAKKVASKEADYGILICTSGEGVCIAANKVNGIRAGIGYNDEVCHLLREHNDANIITFGASFMSNEDILRRTNIFLNSNFEGGRHIARVETINNFKN